MIGYSAAKLQRQMQWDMITAFIGDISYAKLEFPIRSSWTTIESKQFMKWQQIDARHELVGPVGIGPTLSLIKSEVPDR